MTHRTWSVEHVHEARTVEHEARTGRHRNSQPYENQKKKIELILMFNLSNLWHYLFIWQWYDDHGKTRTPGHVV